MSLETHRQSSSRYVERGLYSGSSSLADVIELILDRGLVIDAFVRVSVVGIEILTIDIRIVVASVDTYLRFAEATNRLDLYSRERRGREIQEPVQGARPETTHRGVTGKTSDALESATEEFSHTLAGGRQEREEVPRRPEESGG